MGRALRTYSRSRLEVVCDARRATRTSRGRSSMTDEATERAAEGIAVVAELASRPRGSRARSLGSAHRSLHCLSAGVSDDRSSTSPPAWSGGSGPRPCWRLSGQLPRSSAASPGRSPRRLWGRMGWRTSWPVRRMPPPALPAWRSKSLPDADHPEEAEADVSKSTRTLLEHVVGLTRLDGLRDHDSSIGDQVVARHRVREAGRPGVSRDRA